MHPDLFIFSELRLIFAIVPFLHRLVHAVEPGHVRVQRQMRLQTQTRVHAAAGQTFWPVHWEHGGRDRSQHAVCEGAPHHCCDRLKPCRLSHAGFLIFTVLLPPLSRLFQASFCPTKKWGRMWRWTCSACRWTPRGKPSRRRRPRATPSTRSGRRRPLSSRRSEPVLTYRNDTVTTLYVVTVCYNNIQ